VLFASPPTLSSGSIRFLGAKETVFEGRTWLPRRDTGWLFYRPLGALRPHHRPFVWEGVEIAIPEFGTAYGLLDEPFHVALGYGVPFEAMVSPEADLWDQPCKWRVPPKAQDRGFFREPRYFLERSIRWRWLNLKPEWKDHA
jgi:hypothetical protein